MQKKSLSNIFSLHGKHVLITGAAGLLGRQHAEAICIAGGTPILLDLHLDKLKSLAEQLKSIYEVTCPYESIDITNLEELKSFSRRLNDRGIQVEVLLNNAARNPQVQKDKSFKQKSRLEDFSYYDLILDFNVGIVGALNCISVFGPAMARNKTGNIVNVSSDLGVIAPDQRLYETEGLSESEQSVKPVSYSIVKHGVIGLTRYVATYWAQHNVRCNAISPGGVYNDQNDVFHSRIKKLIPLGRMARANEYQGAVIFLCSEASSYLNGANLIVDGGRSVW